MRSIYVLRDPLTELPFYVGQSRNPLFRLRCHCALATPKHYKADVRGSREWTIVGLKKRGLRPKLEILQAGIKTKSEANRLEQLYIGRMRRVNPKLSNVKTGVETRGGMRRRLAQEHAGVMVKAIRAAIRSLCENNKDAAIYALQCALAKIDPK